MRLLICKDLEQLLTMKAVSSTHPLSQGIASPEALALRVLRPSILDWTLRSGLFIVRPSDLDEWNAWKADLKRELHALGGIVLSLTVADEARGDPESRLRLILEAALAGVTEPDQASGSPLLRGGQSATLSKLITELVELRNASLVLILDGVDQLSQEPGLSLMCALKAARDAVNLDPRSLGSFFLVAVGVDPVAIRRRVLNPREPFFCAELAELAFG
jgi:hypothetical protein